jgi:prepilin peptidase CpaA
MTVAILVLGVLPVLLAAAAVSDLMTYKIPNVIPGVMILLFLAFLIVLAFGGRAMSWSEASPHLLAGALGLLAGLGRFALGWIGGGDAKFFAAATLWLGFDALFSYAIVASLLGGVLTVGLITLRKIPQPAFLVRQAWYARLSDHKGGVPYGIALALAALLILPYTHVFQIAAAG